MIKALMLLHCNPPEGREEAWARWYDETHMPDVCTLPGVVRGTRYKLDGEGAQTVARDGRLTVANYLVVYELDTDDIASLRAAVSENVPKWRAAGRMFEGNAVVSNTVYKVA